MIRQAISCDVCASEKKQTNHWFVAFEQAGELRLSGWSSRNRLRQGMKHLCGQTCLHKLVDEFIARTIDLRVPINSADEAVVPPQTLAPREAVGLHAEFERPVNSVNEAAAHLLTHAEPAAPRRLAFKSSTELVAVPGRQPAPASIETAVRSAQNWRAEAWDREREREMRAVGLPTNAAGRRRSGS